MELCRTIACVLAGLGVIESDEEQAVAAQLECLFVQCAVYSELDIDGIDKDSRPNRFGVADRFLWTPNYDIDLRTAVCGDTHWQWDRDAGRVVSV